MKAAILTELSNPLIVDELELPVLDVVRSGQAGRVILEMGGWVIFVHYLVENVVRTYIFGIC